MRRFIWLVFLPAGLAAQRPAVSPVLPRLLSRVQDTTISVWLFARPTASLDAISERAAAVDARVRVRSSWLHAVSADVPAAALRQLLQDRDLRRVQPLGRFKLRGERPGLIPGIITAPAQGPGDTCGVTPGDDPVLGPSEMPYRLLHLRPLTDQGIDATGVRIALLDTGFDTANPAFNGITITAQYDFVFHDDTVKDQPGKDVAGAQSHGTATWSLFAGDVPGRLHGIARGAHYLLAKTEDIRSETRVEEDNYVHALQWADSIGPFAAEWRRRRHDRRRRYGGAARHPGRHGCRQRRTCFAIDRDSRGWRFGVGDRRGGLVGSDRALLVARADGGRTH